MIEQILGFSGGFEWWQIAIILLIGVSAPMWRKIDLGAIYVAIVRKVEMRKRRRFALKCLHRWIVYPDSNMAQCAVCRTWVYYSTLMVHRQMKCCHVIEEAIIPGRIRLGENSLWLLQVCNEFTRIRD